VAALLAYLAVQGGSAAPLYEQLTSEFVSRKKRALQLLGYPAQGVVNAVSVSPLTSMLYEVRIVLLGRVYIKYQFSLCNPSYDACENNAIY